MKKSTSILGLSVVFVAVLVLFILIFLPKINNIRGMSEDIHPAIESHSEGCISVMSAIYIRLKETAVVGVHHSEGDLCDEGTFSITPSVEGRAIWLDDYTLKFMPTEPLKFGKKYNVEVNMTKLINVGSNPRKYRFEINTIKPNYVASIDDLSMYETEKNVYQLRGYILTDDSFSVDKVEQMLKLKDKNLPVTWVHENRNMRHTFVIDSIAAGEHARQFVVEINGRVMECDKNEKFEIEIPERDAFKLLNVSVEYEPEFRIVATFSDALVKNQRFGDFFELTSSPQVRYMSLVNKLYIYPVARLTGDYELKINPGLVARSGQTLNESYVKKIVFEDLSPDVEFVTKGTIMPTSSSMTIPFRSVNFREIEVVVTKIFPNNILQFLQENDFDGNYEIYRVGKVVAKKRIVLGDSLSNDLKNPKIYHLDLEHMINGDRNAMYRVMLHGVNELSKELDYRYMWRPECRINILLSDLGITAKSNGQGVVSVYVTNLTTAVAESGASVEIFDFTNQRVGSAVTDSEGMAHVKVSDAPHVIVVTSRGSKGYLKIPQGNNLSVSEFDVQGQGVQGERKGYIYGERGVWRPGDQMYLTFMLCDKSGTLPKNHPIKIIFCDPQDQIISVQSRTMTDDGICSFTLKTEEESPAGLYNVKVELGNNLFEKSLRVETIKPNRLKINLDIDDSHKNLKNISGVIRAEWLHGAKASGMNTKMEAEIKPAPKYFDKYNEYDFQDEAKVFENQNIELLSSRLDAEGKLSFSRTLDGLNSVPGMLSAKITARVFEPGGDFSTDIFSHYVAPYARFVGLKLPKSERDNFIATEQLNKFDVVVLDAEANKVEDVKLNVEILKMEWEWWWNTDGDRVAYFMRNGIEREVANFTVETKNGSGQFEYRWNDKDWGLYLIRVSDSLGGHSTAQLVRVDWANASHSTDVADAATMLTLTTDKPRYNVGENVKMTFPSAKGAKALVTVESSSGVLTSKWIECKSENTTFEMVTEQRMSPNVYVWVSLLQPYNQMKNDAPLRLYGVVPIIVDDNTTKLEPRLKTPQEVTPQQKYSIEVSEKSGKPMSYTIAIVDEGLLDLTRFATPNPWGSFYAREALAVRTWDMYNDVVGAYGGSIEQMFSIGGDNEIVSRGDIKAQRFKPIVKFLGPFSLKSGEQAVHTVELPAYVGAVRTMVVAASGGKAFGSAESKTYVRKPLMTLMTLPRVVAIQDIVEVPVTVFAMKDGIGTVDVVLDEFIGFVPIGETKKQIEFNKEGEQTVIFKVRAADLPMAGAIKVKCVGGGDLSEDKIEINIQDHNTKRRVKYVTEIKPNDSYVGQFELSGRKGTNSLQLEVSSLLSVDLSGRISELSEYPHGCLEQIVSVAFPQLYLSNVFSLNQNEANRVQENVTAVLNKILKYRRLDGSLSYWPGSNSTNQWACVWTGHFLVEAQKMGYAIPVGLFERWRDNAKSIARSWRSQDKEFEVQAYRLWVLAMAGEAERGAMNRLRENTMQSPLSKILLAGAYVADGRKDIARSLLESAENMTQEYSYADIFSSVERDMAIKAMVLNSMGSRSQAYDIVRKLADVLSSDRWLSTQETAWSMMAVADIIERSDDNEALSLDYDIAGHAGKINSVKQIHKELIDVSDKEGKVEVKVKNNNSHTVYLTLESVGIPQKGDEQEMSKNISIKREFFDSDGNIVNISQLDMGKDITVRLTITPLGLGVRYDNLALTQLFPSGWEIRSSLSDYSDHRITHKDIRDDRVYVYFNLSGSDSLVLETRLSAVYAGEFYLPGVSVESMYDSEIAATTKGQKVKIVRKDKTL